MIRTVTLALLFLSLKVFAAEPFLEKPYLQLGNSPKLSGSESLVLIWHTDDHTADWTVDVRTSKDHQWRAASPSAGPSSQKVSVPGIAPHLVYRADLTKLIPGEEFEYPLEHPAAAS
jgi:hypothetical protein